MLSSPFYQEVDRSAGLRTAIYVVAEENMNSSHRPDRLQIAIDYSKHLLKQIGAAMNIADGVDTNSARQSRLLYLGF